MVRWCFFSDLESKDFQKKKEVLDTEESQASSDASSIHNHWLIGAAPSSRRRQQNQVRAELAAKRVQLQGLLKLKEAAVSRDGVMGMAGGSRNDKSFT